MVFSSGIFLFIFLPVTLAGYYLLKANYRNVWLLVMSLIFYSWGEPRYIILMLFSIIFNYVLGLLIEKERRNNSQKGAKVVLGMAVIGNLGLLGYFKYFDFLISNINLVAGTGITLRNIALPIGISFFTFQILSYIIDVYRGEEAQHNILNLGLYISLFPQLIAGPIVRYSDIRDQIMNRKTSMDKFYNGCILFMMGFSKKILLADQLAPFVDRVFAGNGYSALAAWAGALAYTFQIYFDFSGYSDMAVGLGRMLGFEFVSNFNYPYLSSSIKEFWRRWHISLSTWFRDYVYIPLGGSRCGSKRTYLNLIVVFLLTGLWHGASWNFVLWGLYYVIFLIIERMGFGRILEKLPKVAAHVYAMIVIIVGWVLFRAENLQSALLYMKSMITVTSDSWIDLASNMNLQYVFCLIVGIIFCMPIGDKIYAACIEKIECTRLKQMMSLAAVFIVFFVAICYMVGSGFSPFLYFRF